MAQSFVQVYDEYLMFLFNEFQPEQFYEGVGAPAVALRINMDNIEKNVQKHYKNLEVEENLHTFFYKTNSTVQDPLGGRFSDDKRQPMYLEDA